MIEKVARVLCAELREDPEAPWQYGDKKAWEAFVPLARLVLEAMREPTEEMRVAALNAGLPQLGEPPLYEKVWTAMIDAALTAQDS